jgi:hypothetical protein
MRNERRRHGSFRFNSAPASAGKLCTSLGGQALHSAFCTRQRRDAALTLIEILIAMFIFLVGCLGVLSVFPVVINNAGRVLGETRGNILAQSVVAQITADCRVNFELPVSGTASVAAVTATPPCNTLTRQNASTQKQSYFVTLLDGPGRGQSRFITADTDAVMTVAPAWTPVYVYNTATPPAMVGTWAAPGSLSAYFPAEHYSITRMGLPERPLVAGEQIVQGWQGPPGPYTVATTWPLTTNTNYNYGSFGLNRDLAVRSFASGNGFYAGIAASAAWTSTVTYNPGNIVSDKGATYICINANSGNEPPNTNYWSSSPAQVALFLEDSNSTGTITNNPATPYGYLTDTKMWSTNQFVGVNVRITSGACAGQVRTVTTNSGSTLTVQPPWVLPPNTSTSSGGYEVGWVGAGTTYGNTWCKSLESNTATSSTNTTLTRSSAAWASNQFQGKYLYLDDGTGTGNCQARAIVSNTGSLPDNTVTPPTPAYTLVIRPPFTQSPGATKYQIMESYGYVLITSGRATNRLFPIVWDAIDPTNTNGHLIVCAGTDFTALNGITAAQSGSQYNLQNATTFTVIGNCSQSQLAWPLGSSSPSMTMLLNAVPDGSAIGSPPTPLSQTPYTTGTVSVTQYQTAVTGTGTSWASPWPAGVIPGEVFVGPDGSTYGISSVVSNTSLTLTSPYAGANPSGPASYTIIPWPRPIRPWPGPYYNIGTVSVVQNSASVTGAGTTWAAPNVSTAEVFIGPDGSIYGISSFLSSTSLTLASPYAGATLSGAAYTIATWPPPWFNTMNIVGHPNRLALDQINVPGMGMTLVTSVTQNAATGIYTVNVASGNGFLNGVWVYASDGTNTIYGQVSSGGGTSFLVLSNMGLVTFGTPINMATNAILVGEGGTYTSEYEYSYGVVFSDSGTDPSLPVRVDVFVWRNFDATKDFVENQKPVGHMSGYIKRP